ncbi:hypothetical protein [Citricoccus sp. GCM10030269]|uniref:hypothetical protein n=1 Tax=Citricoccus sp. GCM10030269 TaxID=3273388 RepID=UPI0036075E0A
MSTPTAGPQPETPRPGEASKDGDPGKAGFLQSIKGPLWFSVILGLVGGIVAMFTASGGTDNPLRVDIGLIAFGVFFIASLVVVAMLQLAAKDNPEHLSRGSGVHRSSEERHRQAVAQRRAEAQKAREAEGTGQKSEKSEKSATAEASSEATDGNTGEATGEDTDSTK